MYAPAIVDPKTTPQPLHPKPCAEKNADVYDDDDDDDGVKYYVA